MVKCLPWKHKNKLCDPSLILQNTVKRHRVSKQDRQRHTDREIHRERKREIWGVAKCSGPLCNLRARKKRGSSFDGSLDNSTSVTELFSENKHNNNKKTEVEQSLCHR